MGWDGVYMDVASTKKMILKDMEWARSHVLAHANGKGGMWILWEHRPIDKDPYVTARFVKIEHRKGETTYKQIDIDCHPYYYDCPSSWLTRIRPRGEMGMEWLEKAKKHAHAMSIEIKPGMEFKYNSVDWKVEYKYSSQKWACRTSQGKLFVIRNANIKEALAV